MYSVAIAKIDIPPSVTRLKKFGYSNAFIMEDIWPLTEVATGNEIPDQQTNVQATSKVTASISTIGYEIEADAT